MIITIDGPVASGKSTVARELARRLGVFHLNTGLLYRATAYILTAGVAPREKADLEKLKNVQKKQLESLIELHYSYKGTEPLVTYQGKEITNEIRQSCWDQAASVVSANAVVREQLLDAQRDIGRQYNIVADGRDCGSIVFPYAEHKFYLTASLDARAARVFTDKHRSSSKNINQIKEEIELRDKRDVERTVAPLRIPEGAIVIDNSSLTFEQTVEEFLKYINEFLTRLQLPIWPARCVHWFLKILIQKF